MKERLLSLFIAYWAVFCIICLVIAYSTKYLFLTKG